MAKSAAVSGTPYLSIINSTSALMISFGIPLIPTAMKLLSDGFCIIIKSLDRPKCRTTYMYRLYIFFGGGPEFVSLAIFYYLQGRDAVGTWSVDHVNEVTENMIEKLTETDFSTSRNPTPFGTEHRDQPSHSGTTSVYCMPCN